MSVSEEACFLCCEAVRDEDYWVRSQHTGRCKEGCEYNGCGNGHACTTGENFRDGLRPEFQEDDLGRVVTYDCFADGTVNLIIFGEDNDPTYSPTHFPTFSPTLYPTTPSPTQFPTTSAPTPFPIDSPTSFPISEPTLKPTKFPTPLPTDIPTEKPSKFPSTFPTTKTPTFSPITFVPTTFTPTTLTLDDDIAISSRISTLFSTPAGFFVAFLLCLGCCIILGFVLCCCCCCMTCYEKKKDERKRIKYMNEKEKYNKKQKITHKLSIESDEFNEITKAQSSLSKALHSSIWKQTRNVFGDSPKIQYIQRDHKLHKRDELPIPIPPGYGKSDSATLSTFNVELLKDIPEAKVSIDFSDPFDPDVLASEEEFFKEHNRLKPKPKRISKEIKKKNKKNKSLSFRFSRKTGRGTELSTVFEDEDIGSEVDGEEESV